MGTVSQFPVGKTASEARTVEPAGELVAMRHIDLDCVIETVRVLRTLADQSFLDCYNRADRPDRKAF